MNDRIREVRKGDRLRADDVNKIAGKLNALDAARPSIVAQDAHRGMAPNLLRVRNDSYMDLDRYAVAGIASLDAPANIEDGVLYAIAGPPSDRTPVVVTVEPIRAGALGWVMAYGTTNVRVRVMNPDHQYARIVERDTDALVSAESGPFEMLQRDPANYAGEAVLAFVRFPTATIVAGEGNALRLHDHRSNHNGGFAMAVYASGGPTFLPWD